MAKIVEVSDDAYSAQKKAVADRAEDYTVTGGAGVRDCVTRDIVSPGGIVRLDPQQKGLQVLINSGAVRRAEKAAKADQKA